MILSDREIRAALARDALRVTPVPMTEAWSSTAIDLSLAKELVVWKRPDVPGVEAVVCPAHPEFKFDAVRTLNSTKKPKSGQKAATTMPAWCPRRTPNYAPSTARGRL